MPIAPLMLALRAARSALVWRRKRAVLALCLGILPAATAPAAPPPPPETPLPRARLLDVSSAFLQSGDAPMPGAGVRAFQVPEPDGSGTERFDIRWYAAPPGLPAGAVLLLECIQDRSPAIRNRVLRLPEQTQGHARCAIEIPPEAIREAGRVRHWRLSLVWRGRVLDRQTSPHWEG